MWDDILRIGVHGASGKMGIAVITQIFKSFYQKGGGAPNARLAATLGHRSSNLLGTDLRKKVSAAGIDAANDDWLVAKNSIYLTDVLSPNDIDVMIDFSVPTAAKELLVNCAQAKIPLVTGTTGFTPAQTALFHETARVIPILISPNMSLAVNVLFSLIAQAVNELGLSTRPGNYDIEIAEMHHRLKKDSPSGTALRMHEIATRASRIETDMAAPRIGIAALRGGTLLNEHRITFAGAGEQLELIHRAANPEVYAQGAIAAAQFLHGAKPRIYSMKEVLAAGD